MKAPAIAQWTPTEDDLLRGAVRRHGVRRWEDVAAAIPDRSQASCSARWEELQSTRVPLTRQPWSPQEDAFLSTFVNYEGAGHWTMAASLLPGRTAKQCRERWHYQLYPSIKREAWSAGEDALLVTMQCKLGNAWSRMAAYLPGRTDNAIKNRWHSARFRARMQQAGYHNWNTTEETQAGGSLMAPADGMGMMPPFSPLNSSVEDDLEGMWADVAACLLDEDPYDGDGHDGE